jgi:hypothetical protein
VSIFVCAVALGFFWGGIRLRQIFPLVLLLNFKALTRGNGSNVAFAEGEKVKMGLDKLDHRVIAFLWLE